MKTVRQYCDEQGVDREKALRLGFVLDAPLSPIVEADLSVFIPKASTAPATR